MIYRLFVSEIPAEQVVFHQHVSHAILHRLGNLWQSENNGKLVAREQAYGFVLGFALALARGVYELTPKWFRRSLGARTCSQTTALLDLCQVAMQTVTDHCWFRNLIQAVVIEEQVLTEVTDQPILLSQTQGVRRYTFTEVVDFRVRKIIYSKNVLPFR